MCAHVLKPARVCDEQVDFYYEKVRRKELEEKLVEENKENEQLRVAEDELPEELFVAVGTNAGSGVVKKQPISEADRVFKSSIFYLVSSTVLLVSFMFSPHLAFHFT